MKYLIDTHAFLWYSINDPQLTPKVKDIIENIDHEIFLSVASVWEIVIKHQLGKLVLPTKPEIFITEQLEINHFSTLSINLFHTFESKDLPFHHKDPFDRMLVAQSIVENIPVITADSKLKEYGIVSVW